MRAFRCFLAGGTGLALAAGMLGTAAIAEAGAVGPGRALHRNTGSEGPETSAPTEREALDEAKRSGKKVEVVALRGETRDVFATPKGTLEAREYLRPVRTRSNGEWKPVDTTLTKATDGRVAPRTATIGIRFSGGGDTALVELDRAGRKVALSWPTKLPEPRLDGDTATYPDVLPDVDLRVAAQADGFTQLLVVKSAKAAASKELAQLRLKMQGTGVTVQQTPQGGLKAEDQGAGGVVFEAPTPMMWDSSSGPSPLPKTGDKNAKRGAVSRPRSEQEPTAGESGKLAKVGVDVPSGGRELVLTPDRKVLASADTVYPVFIDPQWYSPRSSTWTMVSKYWADTPQWKFNGNKDAGLGYCDWNHCNPGDTKRLFYEIPTSQFAGKSILSAEFVVPETWSASCEKKGVQLWLTRGISSSTTWNSQTGSDFWAKKLDEQSFAHGYEGCASDDAEFNVRDIVQNAANRSWNDITFGLKASDESDTYAWKRFADRAYLRVQYNQPPQQVAMSQLSMEYGGACKEPEQAAHVRTLGQVYANDVTDPDGDDIAVEFQAEWDNGDGKGTVARWTPGLTGFKKSGSDFSMALPADLPVNTTISWYVRAYDRLGYSPWSAAGPPTGCYFVRDPRTLPAPKVSSIDYPESKPGAAGDGGDPWIDGVGKYGSFTLGPATKDITKYIYGVNGDASAKNTVATTEGAARTIKALPSEPGLNFVTVQALDAAGNTSEPYTYRYKVRAGQPERAAWQMDDGPDAQQAQGTSPARTAQLHGGAVTGGEGIQGKSLSLNGTDAYAGADASAVDTSTGFTVSAWARLSKAPAGDAVVVAQAGNNVPAFQLGYSRNDDRWTFDRYASDTAGTQAVRAKQQNAGGAKAGEWNHLVGVYDNVAGELRLFVNGKQEAGAPFKTPWDAHRGLQIGAGTVAGKATAFFPGDIDELQVFDRAVPASEVARLYAKEHLGGPGGPARASFPFDEAEGAKEVTGRAEVLPAVFHGGPKAATPGVAGKALALDGVDDYATVDAPHFNSTGSFAVSVWARLAKDKLNRSGVVFTQAGVNASGGELFYSTSRGGWVFNQHTADVIDPTDNKVVQNAGTPAKNGEWAHLVAIRDTTAGTLTLYVNGILAGSTPISSTPWYAGKQFQIGAGSYAGKPGNYFPGEIDDLRIYDRPLAPGEVQQLFKQRPLVKGRWQFDAASGTPAVSPDAVTDPGAVHHDMLLAGKAEIGAGHVDAGGLKLNGVDASASTNGVPVDTSGSFTVTAWAQRVADRPGRAMTLLSAEGNSQNAFAVRYVPGAAPAEGGRAEGRGRWQVTLPSKDADKDVTVTTVDNGAFEDAGAWNHIAVVYDGFAHELRLYVNGNLEQLACGAAGDGTQNDPSPCADRFSHASNAVAFAATKSFQVGRSFVKGTAGEYWSGQVDDVWAFQGALTGQQVSLLAKATDGRSTEVPQV
ncbi:LamG-like jellyroll fold domain-containing protein [Streptomyces sp. NPDC049555]|uniref:LamG-like jellyroll fold domain-containing protein n=1 Tax=Streptomyces sp. NPDC049555 TaxID=3154930 RepID=UPI0034419EA7